MQTKRVLKAPIIAVLGLLAFLLVPAAAQAHHAESTAKCELVGNVPTVTLTVTFKSFSSTKQVTGTITFDGAHQKSVVPADISWSGNNGSLTWTKTTTGGQHTVKGDFTWPNKGDNNGKAHHTVTCPAPASPKMTIEKDGPATRYVGDTAVFTIKVTNTGNVVLPNPVVTDPKCDAPPVKVTQQNQFDPGDVWTYTCSATITDAMGDQLVNTACAEAPGKKVCDDHTTDIPKPAIQLVKTGVASAKAGDTVTYEFAATNTGNVTLGNVQLTDDKCQSTLARKAGETDTVFDGGDVWNYTCTAVVPAGVTSLKNVAEVCGTYTPPTGPPTGVGPKTVCDEDDHEFPVPPTDTPPTDTPPTDIPPTGNPPAQNPPASTPQTPSGGVLPKTIASGVARLRGPSGCVKQAFRARVSGRSIASVTFSVDGRVVKTFNSRRSSYSITVNPQRYGFGRHRVVARVRFVEGSGTAARRLPLTFRRCAQDAVAPRFTG